MPELGADLWSTWLLKLRHAGDPTQAALVEEAVALYADKVIDGAALRPGMTVADIGSGDGLIVWRSLARMDAELSMILVDISEPLLARAEARAKALDLSARCRFLRCSAERLDGIGDGTVDVVTSRSAIAYVPDKAAAFAEMFRVLRPGGRISLGEPLFRDEALSTSAMRILLDREPRQPTSSLLSMMHRWKAAQFPDTEAKMAITPITSYAERDLLRFAEKAGFRPLHMEVHTDTHMAGITDWSVFVGVSPHPMAPTLQQILAEQFTAGERMALEAAFRPEVEAGRLMSTVQMVYLTGSKPM
ncbi:MAG: class I SAM-dependent methyltransferase [Proteobacteria bacterium]|nr:class I SAM-dependent methyltransferase [Pseudomonadota bacterium]